MTAIVIDALHRRFREPDVGIAVVYCNYKMQEEQNARTFLADLVKQLAKQKHTQSRRVKALVEVCARAKRKPSLIELADLLRRVTKKYTDVFIAVDALDECQSAEWPQLISTLQQLQARVPAVRVMVTARPQLMLGTEFRDAVRTDICAHAVDLRQYIDSQVSRLSKHVVRTAGIKEVVTQGIIQAANGM